MDPDNIFQLLMGGNQDPSQAPATNVLQALDPSMSAPAAPPQAPQAPVSPPPAQPADVAAAANAASPPIPQKRHSLLDTIGRISDVFAKVGGANPLYQPTLDAREDRFNAQGDHARKVDAENLKYATDKFDLSDKQTAAADSERSRFANVLGAVSDPQDAGNLPQMMQAAGLTDARYAPFIKMVQDNPESAKVLASALGGGEGDETGKSIKTGYDAKGNRVAYVVDSDGNPHILSGVTPDANFKVVNTGDKTSLVGPNGLPTTIIPNKVSPNTAANNAQSNTNNIRTTNTQVEIAGMPARAKDGAPGKGAGVADPNVPTLLDNIEAGFQSLHGMNALPGEGGALGQIEGAIGRTAVGQKVGEQFGTPAAQKRLEIMKNVSQLQQAMLKSLPASATRTKFEQEMLARGLPDPSKMSLGTARTVIQQLRQSYAQAVASLPKAQAAAPATSGNSNLPTLSPADAAKLPPGTQFRTLDGRVLVRH